MTRRYFCNELAAAGGLVSLSSEEAGHASRVMRANVGDSITLFDGVGNEAEATIESLGRSECVCVSGATRGITRMPSVDLHLGVALPKPDRAKELIERLTELGVASVTPITAERTQRAASPSLINKLRRVVVEACKQCERNVLMRIADPITSKEFFQSPQQGRCVIAHQGEDCVSGSDLKSETRIVFAVGPEGGWTDGEVGLAGTNGFSRINLGERIYRIETAAVALASALVTR
ncbi:Ribosomal RNA small subunit methyltransferase E [Rubripirellula obstinata]|uniref:Ribosomal RNA small subunit methyltransferase E n=1 Tax=Rubripirellula obstinata TaxID=406547 RepID=A0A5B1CEC6_9BACT|nr:RsmE family RNA methyltransferase [Rubripirellula obstinata]KAA1258571.1 Ribosomal RNA small subunit methyltransferase E [Rubripirellula obstinata]